MLKTSTSDFGLVQGMPVRRFSFVSVRIQSNRPRLPMLCASPAIIWPPAGRRWPTAAQAATLTAHALPWLRSDLLQLQAATLRSSKAFTVQARSYLPDPFKFHIILGNLVHAIDRKIKAQCKCLTAQNCI